MIPSSISLAPYSPAPVTPTINKVSLPAPVSILSTPCPPLTTSSPAPVLITSSPPFPSITAPSVPSSPVITSCVAVPSFTPSIVLLTPLSPLIGLIAPKLSSLTTLLLLLSDPPPHEYKPLNAIKYNPSLFRKLIPLINPLFFLKSFSKAFFAFSFFIFLFLETSKLIYYKKYKNKFFLKKIIKTE